MKKKKMKEKRINVAGRERIKENPKITYRKKSGRNRA